MTSEGRRRIGRSGLLVSAAAGAVVALVMSLVMSGSWRTQAVSFHHRTADHDAGAHDHGTPGSRGFAR